MNIERELFKLKDERYKDFHSKLMPTVDTDKIIGVRTPALRKLAKDFSKTEESKEFLKKLPHKYYEEDNLHAFLIEQIKNFDTAISETERFLPYIDNWATCDLFFPKIFNKNKRAVLLKIDKWIKSDKTYTVRYAIGLLMRMFLDEDFDTEYLDMVAEVRSEEYYINMMIAWYFATALAKRYDASLPYITGHKLDTWTHNKAIQKAIESNRIDKDVKVYLRELKLKNRPLKSLKNKEEF